MRIKIKNLSHTFDIKQKQELKALQDINATIETGMSISIIGHTGSGKTTFIEHLNGLIKPTSGSINITYKVIDDKIKDFIVMEKEITNTKKKIKDIKQIRKNIGIVFQFAEYQLFEETIEKDIMFGPITMGVSKSKSKELAKRYIQLVGLSEKLLNKSPFSLSGGQKRRVALAGILAMDPSILVFDEPTAGLDPQGSKEILDIFDRLHKEGKTIIIVTHNLDDALSRTDYTMMFVNGKLIKFDDSYTILKDTQFLLKSNLEPPKILDFVNKLEKKGIKLPKIRNINDLVKHLNINKQKRGNYGN